MIVYLFQKYPENFCISTTYNYLPCSNLPVKISIFLRSSLFFNCFCCLFWFELRLYGSITYKLEQLWMQKFQRLLFLLKRSYICYYIICMTVPLTLSRRRPLSYRNQSIDLLCKSMDWFLYDNGLRLESVNQFAKSRLFALLIWMIWIANENHSELTSMSFNS